MRRQFMILSSLLASVVLLSGCNNSGLSDASVSTGASSDSSGAPSSAPSATTVDFDVVDISAAYTEVPIDTDDPIWAGNSGKLDPSHDFDYPYNVKSDKYESTLNVNAISDIRFIIVSGSKYTLAESANIADTNMYKLSFDGLVDDNLIFTFVNKNSETCSFDLDCISINNFYLTNDSSDNYNIYCENPSEIVVKSGESVTVKVQLSIPKNLSSVDLKECVIRYKLDDQTFYGRVLGEDNGLNGHIYVDKYKAFTPVRYRWCYLGDEIFIKDGIYGYKSYIKATLDEDNHCLNFRFGVLNNSLFDHKFTVKLKSIGGKKVVSSDSKSVVLPSCGFATIDMNAVFDNSVFCIDDMELEVNVDGSVSTVQISFDETLSIPGYESSVSSDESDNSSNSDNSSSSNSNRGSMDIATIPSTDFITPGVYDDYFSPDVGF